MRFYRYTSIAILAMVGGAAFAALPPVEEGNSQTAPRTATANSTTGLLEIYNRMQRLQQEVQALRGELEEQAYTLDNINQRQRDLYLDLDRRIQQLESGAPRSAQTPPVAQEGQMPPPLSQRSSAGMTIGDKAAYEAAFESLKNGQYEASAKAFEAFVTNHPNSTYLANALYWQGEARYVTRDFDRAMALFKQVTSNHSGHSKAKDALLKIGFIHYEKKQWAAARDALQSVINQYPGSSAALLAKRRLSKMPQ